MMGMYFIFMDKTKKLKLKSGVRRVHNKLYNETGFMIHNFENSLSNCKTYLDINTLKMDIYKCRLFFALLREKPQTRLPVKQWEIIKLLLKSIDIEKLYN